MYSAPAHQQNNLEKQIGLMQSYPFATLVSIENGQPQANHIPLIWKASDNELGVLQGHVARANTLWQQHDMKIPLLAIFHGPDTYISPELYASKPRTGKVVPTWSYATVHATGSLKVFDRRQDDRNEDNNGENNADWLERHLAELSLVHDADRTPPWKIEDAPRKFIDAMKRAIVGIEINIDTLQGKWKLSQKETSEDRDSIAKGLAESIRPSDIGMHEFIAKQCPTEPK